MKERCKESYTFHGLSPRPTRRVFDGVTHTLTYFDDHAAHELVDSHVLASIIRCLGLDVLAILLEAARELEHAVPNGVPFSNLPT